MGPKQWLNDNLESFQEANAKHGITGAIMMPHPENERLVIQYFEGSMAECQQLANNIKNHKKLERYYVLGEGFIGKRFFGNWTMKRETSLKETMTMLNDFVFRKNKDVHDYIEKMLAPKVGSWESFSGKVLFGEKVNA